MLILGIRRRFVLLLSAHCRGHSPRQAQAGSLSIVKVLVSGVNAAKVHRARARPVVDAEAFVLELYEALRPLQVPKLVEQGVVLFLLERLNHDV